MSNSKWKKAVWDNCGGVCVVCGKAGSRGNPLTVHHLKAKCHNGKDTIENCVLWHRNFHRNYHKKYGNRTSDIFGNPV